MLFGYCWGAVLLRNILSGHHESKTVTVRGSTFPTSKQYRTFQKPGIVFKELLFDQLLMVVTVYSAVLDE